MSWTLLAYTLAIWLMGLAGVLTPLVMASYNTVVLTLCNSFAAGVMLSAGFVHLLHDAVSSLSGLQKKMGGYPISEFVCALSFICVFYIETLFAPPIKPGEHHHLDHIQVDKGTECFPSQWEWQAGQSPTRAARTHHKHKGKQQQQQQQEGGSSPPLPQYGAVVPPSTATTAAAAGGSSRSRKEGKKTLSPPQKRIPTGPTTRLLEGTGNDHPTDTGAAAAAEGEDEINTHVAVRTGLLAHMQHTFSHHVDLEESATEPGKHHHNHHHDHHDENASARAAGSSTQAASSSSSSSSSPAQAHSLNHSHGHGHNHSHSHGHGGGEVDALGLPLHGHKDLHTLAGALCLLAALGFHSVIEGLGLATASSQKDATQVGVFLAILAHKGLAGLTLGSTMLLAEVNQSEFLCTALLFSAATPLGVGLGVLISVYCQTAVALGLMAAVAAGTFIHVAAIEIIPSAFRDTSATQFAKLASLTMGFLAMSALFLVA